MNTTTIKFIRAVALSCALGAASANAVMPDSGWYWNTGESGRGFQIEIQNNMLFLSAFMYGNDGAPIWVVAGGPMSSDHTFSAGGIQTSGGQCVGCPYVVPTVIPYGPVSVDFTSPTTATITLNGIAIQTVRQQFGFDFTSTTSPMLGEWALVDGDTSFPLYFGERVTLSSTQTLNGTPYAVGNRSGESGVNNIAVSRFDPASGKWLILLDSSPSYYELFNFTFAAFDRVEGTEYVYLKTDQPTTGVASIGNRIKSGAAAAGMNAPGTDKAAAITPDNGSVNQSDADLARRIAARKSGIQASLAIQAIAGEMACALMRALPSK